MTATFLSKIAGIPCIIEVTEYTPVVKGCYSGPPERCYPDEGGDFDFEVCDRRGRPAPWLATKLKSEDSDRLFKEFETHQEKENG